MVGTGDMWEVPKSASDINKGNYPTMDAPFKSYKCGERGSQIAIIDTMIKNVTDNIVQGWNALTETITNAVQSNLDADRSKRQVMRTTSYKTLSHIVFLTASVTQGSRNYIVGIRGTSSFPC